MMIMTINLTITITIIIVIIIIIIIITHMLHVWYIYLQNWLIYGVNVGKYSSTMEHTGLWVMILKILHEPEFDEHFKGSPRYCSRIGSSKA